MEVDRKNDVCHSCCDELVDEVVYGGDRAVFDEAERIKEDPNYISQVLRFGDLLSVINDQDSTRLLRKLLLENDPVILVALDSYSHRKTEKKPGRKPKRMEADYLTVYRLRKSGLSFGKIALRMWNDSSKSSRARAHYNRALKSGLPRLPSSGKPSK